MSAVTGASIELARRRRVRQLRIALAAVTLLPATLVLGKAIGPVFAEAQAPSAATVSGGVYAGRNGNGERDAGERGLEGVSVSDGVTIVETRSDGRCAIQTDAAIDGGLRARPAARPSVAQLGAACELAARLMGAERRFRALAAPGSP